MPNSTKVRLVENELLHVNGQTDMIKLIGDLRTF
jgi:hypothetical protein